MPDLATTTLVMVVGPSSIGKSTLMNEVTKLDPRFGRVKSFTTRPPRPNDEPGQYIYLTNEELSQRADLGKAITDVIYPTTGYHYGTVAESFSNSINLLDTLAHSVAEYRKLPFARTITISLTTEPEAWSEWLRQRFPNGGSDYVKRLEEAISSMTWSLAQTSDHHWLVNRPNTLTQTAGQLIELIDSGQPTSTTPSEAKALLATAKNLLSYQLEKRERDA